MKGRMRVKSSDICYIAIACITIIELVPAVKVRYAGGTYRYIMMGLLGIWFLATLLYYYRRPKIDRLTFATIAYAFFLVIIFCLNFFGCRAEAINIILPLLPFAVFCQMESVNDDSKRKFIVCLTLVLLASVEICTIIASLKNPYITRTITEGTYQDAAVLYRQNVGDLFYAYMASLVFLALFARRKKFRKTKGLRKMLLYLTALMSIFMVIIGSSGITIIATILGLAVILFLERRSETKVLWLVCTVMFLMIGTKLLGEAMIMLSEIMNNKIIASKAYDIGVSLIGGRATGQVSARTDRYMNDIRTFFRTCFIGAGSHYYDGVVDGHSGLFGNMARYGVVWLAFIVHYFTLFFRAVGKAHPENHYNGGVFAAFLFMYCAQPVFSNYGISAVLCYVIPYFDYLFDTR